MILFSLILSGVLLVLIACVLRAPGGAAIAAIISVLATLFGLASIATAFAAQAALTVVVLIVCGARGVSWWGTFRGTLIAAGIVYGLFAVSAIPELIHLRRLRASYPVTSLADRLAYERALPAGDIEVTAVDASQRRLRSELEFELQEQEVQEQQADYRSYGSHFRRLHTATASDFIFGIGFGAARMGYIRPSQLRLPDEPPPVPQPTPSEPSETYAVEGELPPPVPTRFDF